MKLYRGDEAAWIARSESSKALAENVSSLFLPTAGAQATTKGKVDPVDVLRRAMLWMGPKSACKIETMSIDIVDYAQNTQQVRKAAAPKQVQTCLQADQGPW